MLLTYIVQDFANGDLYEHLRSYVLQSGGGGGVKVRTWLHQISQAVLR